MEKTDLTKRFKSYYSAKSQPELVEVESACFLSIAGKGDPSGADFAEALQALYSVAYTIKFACKANGNDFVVAKLEGLWEFDTKQYPDLSIAETLKQVPRSEWQYRALIRMPEFVTEADAKNAVGTVLAKKELERAAAVTLYMIPAHTAVQMLHKGPFATELESLEQIQAFCREHKLDKDGPHHEIYLSDFRRTAPEKLRTILREPVQSPTH
jgi:hypothetical protein